MAANFRVLFQRQSQELTPDGRFIDVMEVTFETIPAGQSATERFPLTGYSPENVAAVLTERANVMQSVQDL